MHPKLYWDFHLLTELNKDDPLGVEGLTKCCLTIWMVGSVIKAVFTALVVEPCWQIPNIELIL